MSDDRKRIVDGISEGIEIDRELALREGLPEELDAGVVGPYRFPDPRRRRVSGWLYIGTAAVVAVLALNTPRYWVMFALLLVLAGWHFAASWPLALDQEGALDRSSKVVPFAVGHASAAVTFRGVRSRPRWHVVAYSADDPPTERALVEFDAVSGDQQGEPYVERVPEQ
jgi:hypothetical protein